MFFKRAKQENTKDKSTSIAEPEAPAKTGSVEPLPPGKLRTPVDPEKLDFTTTADLSPTGHLIGQDRALRAIAFAAAMTDHDFNLFVIGPPASGKATAVKAYLSQQAETEPAPCDWIYVNNFDSDHKPRAIPLTAGQAPRFEKAMVAAIDELRAAIPAAFASEEAEARRRAIDEEHRAHHDAAFEALKEKASAQNIAILRTPTGFTMAPMMDGKVVRPEVFANLPPELHREVQNKVEALQEQLASILSEAPESERAHRSAINELNRELAQRAITAALSSLRSDFSSIEAITRHVDTVEEDLVRNFALFLNDPDAASDQPVIKGPADTVRDPRLRRYMINVAVTNDPAQGAPVVVERNPTYAHLVGSIEHIAQMGALLTDFLLIKAGALHQANGGYLLLDARKLLNSPFTWEALKRALKAREIRVEQPPETSNFASTQSLNPEPIPLKLKVVLFGEHELYQALVGSDPDFEQLFQVQAEFEESVERSDETEKEYSGLVASIIERHGLKPLDASGVARIIEESARMARDARRLSVEVGRIANIVREADYLSSNDGREIMSREDIDTAIARRIERSDRIRDRAQETIDREIVLVDTSGAKVGQINGLSVQSIGNFSFGRPNRITARVRIGSGRVTDIEREVKLGGSLHSKGVMILWGYLAGKFARDVNLALSASLVFEQSYGGVDGDSASSAELYALLSALSHQPINQGYAVTGSVNQLGEVQAIGGANEKIEGYFDVCASRGLTGDQGVLIPASNVQHLMLREDIVAAAEDGKFNIWPVSTIDEGIEILTGVEAGKRGDDGAFPTGTINARVEDQLRAYAEAARKHAPGIDAGPGAFS